MAKNGRFWSFYLVSSYSTVTTSNLMLQNVSYHHTEQFLQTWIAHKCLVGLMTTKMAQKWPKTAVFGHFWAIICDYKPFEASMGTAYL